MRISAPEALGRLRRLRKPVLTTGDAALHLGMTRTAASGALARLERAGLVQRIRRGLWSLDEEIDPLVLPEYLTAPFPAYVSFQSALQLHGMITQIPHVVYVASLAPTRRLRTRVATYSIHRLAPGFFGGYDTTRTGVRLARPEKALLDTLYLTPARSRLFAHLPEVEIPSGFDRIEARRWLARIPAGLRRAAVESRLDRILGARPAGPSVRGHRRRGWPSRKRSIRKARRP
jgi:DNA-binding transcriptional ArsR family regulator